jgi:NAD(P)-dependent dehydrogenase (short-subunit alcohol dehydrogenase family)
LDKRLLIVGATGDVGRGITEISVQKGWKVVAAARNQSKLDEIKSQHQGLATVAGDLSSEAQAEQLWTNAAGIYNGIDAVIISVNAPIANQLILDASSEELLSLFQHNVISHFNAAKAFLPKLPKDGLFIGIGGGMADFIMPKMAQHSMAQSALRQMYRGIVKEAGEDAPIIKELMILSMVNGVSCRERAKPSWVTDLDIGNHVCAILDNPSAFSKTILTLQSREQVGH